MLLLPDSVGPRVEVASRWRGRGRPSGWRVRSRACTRHSPCRRRVCWVRTWRIRGRTRRARAAVALVCGQRDGDVLSEGGGVAADVDGDVEDRAEDDADELVLRVRGELVVQAAEGAGGGGERLVVLHELDVDAGVAQRVALVDPR